METTQNSNKPLKKFLGKFLEKLPFEKMVKNMPGASKKIDQKMDKVLGDMDSLFPEQSQTSLKLPLKGQSEDEILSEIQKYQDQENKKWIEGKVSGAVYQGDENHLTFMNKVYALTSQTNPLHSDLWPSINKFENELVSMCAQMLGAKPGDGTCGSISSGGTESILLAMKAYRDYALEVKGITKPELIVPITAHAAFDKACEYFKIKKKVIPFENDFTLSPQKVERAITKNTIALVGSAPNFPYGLIDPITEMSKLATTYQIGLHVDGCLGGLFLPWAKKLGYPVPDFDFSLPGVTSISVDTHKFGFAPKGTSVILYRNQKLRHYQFFTITDWPGGLYFSPTFAGSRPGATIAQAWAAMVHLGEEGYLKTTQKILDASEKLKEGLSKLPEIQIIGSPLWVVAFQSKELNIYQILDFLSKKGWNLNGLHRPPSLHFCLTLRQTKPGVIDQFLTDLSEAITYVKSHPDEKGTMAPIYGMGGTIPFRGMVKDLLIHYLDRLYRPL